MINIKDNLNTLTADQTQALRDKSTAYPFDIYVTIGQASDAEIFVTGPRSLAIGVDPAHHHTFVRGSVDLNLPDGPEIASSGNAFFRRADIVGGIDAIAAKSKEYAATARITTTADSTPIVVQEKPMASGWWYGLGGLGVVVLVVGVWAWLRNRSREDEQRRLRAELLNATGDALMAKAERGEIEEFDRKIGNTRRAYDIPVRVPTAVVPTYVAPQPVVIQDDLVTGLVIGEMLAPEPVAVYSPPVSYTTPDPTPAMSSWDSGSSSISSNWSDTSSSGSYDSGSSSSYDTGSSWSGGGGGSDW